MAKLTKTQTTVLLIVVLVGVVFGANTFFGPDGFATKSSGSKTKGNPNAELKIVEFIDFQCPACAAGSRYLSELIKTNPDLLHLELKYFPLGGHIHAMLASQFAECSRQQGKFWDFHDLILERQKDWARLVVVRPAFELIAQEVGLNIEKLNKCVENPKTEQTVLAEKTEGKGLKIRSTPTYFINGKMVVGMKALKDELKQVLPE